jgi:hypothetical protein
MFELKPFISFYRRFMGLVSMKNVIGNTSGKGSANFLSKHGINTYIVETFKTLWGDCLSHEFTFLFLIHS